MRSAEGVETPKSSPYGRGFLVNPYLQTKFSQKLMLNPPPLKGGGGGMVTDFSGTSILSNEFVVIDRASTDNLWVLLGPRAQ